MEPKIRHGLFTVAMLLLLPGGLRSSAADPKGRESLCEVDSRHPAELGFCQNPLSTGPINPADFNLKNSQQLAQLIQKLSLMQLDDLEMTPARIAALETMPFPFFAQTILATGAEKAVFDLGDGRVLKIAARAPRLPLPFDVIHLQSGVIERNAVQTFYWTEPKLLPVSVEEIEQLERTELIPRKYGIRDYKKDQFGKNSLGKVYVLDQGAVAKYAKTPPQVAKQLLEIRKMRVKMTRPKTLSSDEQVDYIMKGHRDLLRIKNLDPEFGATESSIIYRELEERLRDLEYPVEVGH